MKPLTQWFRKSPSQGDAALLPQSETSFKVLNATRGTVLGTDVEVADTDAKRTKGLLGRKELPAGSGLWILPCEAIHTFFMQFPIDIVYIDRQRRIKKVRSALRPWRLSACLSAHSVVELPVGVVAASQSQRGDQLEFVPASQGDMRSEPGIGNSPEEI